MVTHPHLNSHTHTHMPTPIHTYTEYLVYSGMIMPMYLGSMDHYLNKHLKFRFPSREEYSSQQQQDSQQQQQQEDQEPQEPPLPQQQLEHLPGLTKVEAPLVTVQVIMGVLQLLMMGVLHL